ncbi:MAG: dialkylresorcinol condensing enzyme DarA [Salibacteraceae bacterium]
MKKVLVVYYSQTGQLRKILDKITNEIQDCEIEHFQIELEHKFPFPWNRKDFFSVMPDCVNEKAYPLVEKKPSSKDYDLIILGYQVWFLSPSIPLTSFLKSGLGAELLNGKNVMTVIGGRNMWVMAHESVKKSLKALNSNLIGNVALMDRAPNLISVVTIIYWLFHNKTGRLLNLFPTPGVKEIDINKGEVVGKELSRAIQNNSFSQLQNKIIEAKAVALKHDIISMETKAKRVFGVWATIINGAGKLGKFPKKIALFIFEIYLYLVIILISPLISIFSTFVAIFRRKAIAKKMSYYSQV